MTPAQKRDRALKYVMMISILGLGIAIGIAIRHYYNIPMVEAINIVDVATLIVTIFLAVYIPGVFDRQMQVKQDKKELIEHRIDELQEFYRQINLLVQQNAEKPKDILFIRNMLDVAANRLGIIFTLLDYLELGDAFEKDTARIRFLCDQYQQLLLQAEPGADSYSYPDEVRRQEESLCNQIEQATSILVFKISDI